VTNLENQRNEFERKYNKEKSNWEYLESQIEIQKTKNTQLLEMIDNLGELDKAQESKPEFTQEEYDNIKIRLESRIEENKTLKNEKNILENEVSEWRKKIVEDSEKNNDYVKGLITQIKEMHIKNSTMEKKSGDFRKQVESAMKQKNEEIFKLQEKIKATVIDFKKLKKKSIQKNLDRKSSMDINSGYYKELAYKIEDMQNDLNLKDRTIKDYELIIKEKTDEISLVYQKMDQIADKIKNKNIDSNLKKLTKDNQELMSANSKLEIEVKTLSDKVKRREKLISDVEKEKDKLTENANEYRKQLTELQFDPSTQKSPDSQRMLVEFKKIQKENGMFSNKIELYKEKISKQTTRLDSMQIINLCLVSMNKQKIKYVDILKSWCEDIPPSKEAQLVKLKQMESKLAEKLNELSNEIRGANPRLSKAMDEVS